MRDGRGIGRAATQQLTRFLRRQGVQLHAGERAGAVGSLERGRQGGGKLTWPGAQGQQDCTRRRPVQQRDDEVDRRRVRRDYRRPQAVPAGPVLVVGGGSTGFQIAEELAGTHEVHLSIGSRQMPVPQRLLGRDLFTFLTATGLMSKTRDSRIGRRMRDRETLVGSSPRAARKRGIVLHGRTSGAEGSSIRFADGTRLEVRTVIWATGFSVDHSWIDVPVLDAGGALVHERGVTASPGPYVLGMPWQHTRGSALLGWVAEDARYLAGHIAATPQRAMIAP